ncbi:hypothetical protein LZ30DRAFT_690270 [Colletotrichum cereale]|nr:hypothetical protein LZ30DRAFT_690270 [Colletotrichum cereale]
MSEGHSQDRRDRQEEEEEEACHEAGSYPGATYAIQRQGCHGTGMRFRRHDIRRRPNTLSYWTCSIATDPQTEETQSKLYSICSTSHSTTQEMSLSVNQGDDSMTSRGTTAQSAPGPSEPVGDVERNCTTSNGDEVAVTLSEDEKMNPRCFNGTAALATWDEVILTPTSSENPRDNMAHRCGRPSQSS